MNIKNAQLTKNSEKEQHAFNYFTSENERNATNASIYFNRNITKMQARR